MVVYIGLKKMKTGVKGVGPLGLPPPLGERGGHPLNSTECVVEMISTEPKDRPFYKIIFDSSILFRGIVPDGTHKGIAAGYENGLPLNKQWDDQGIQVYKGVSIAG
jgi:hypothetical protein